MYKRQTLSLLYSDNPGEHPDGPQLYNEDGSRILPDDALRIDRRVTIGAVLEPEISGKSLSAQLPGYFHCAMGNILTTGAGLNALGFDPPYDVLEVTPVSYTHLDVYKRQPLRKAARIPPMQALRDLELTRRLKRSRLASRLHFDVPRHTARRSSILYKNRQLGTTAMLAVSIVLLSLAAFGAKPLLSEASYDYGCDYMLINQSRMTDWLMEYGLHRPGITEQDRADAAALKGVKAVSYTHLDVYKRQLHQRHRFPMPAHRNH